MSTLAEGSNALLRHFWEATPGVTPWDGTPHYMRFNSESLASAVPLIQPNSIRGGRQRTKGLPSKITAAGPVALDLEPEGHGYFFCAFQKGGDTVSTLTAGQSYRHKLAPSYTTVNHDKTSTIQVSRGDKMPQLSPGCLPGNFDVVLGIQSVMTGSFNWVAQRASYYPLATAVAETSTPTRPILRGFPKYAVANSADPDIYVVVDNASGTVKVKVGSAGTLTAAQTITAATWTTLNYHPASADVPIGEVDNPVQLYVPNFTGWTAGGTPDTWRFKFNHADNLTPWTPTFPSIEAMNEIHGTILIGGTEYKIRELTLSGALGTDPNFGIGGRYSDGVLETGVRAYSGQLNRRKLDNSLLIRLEASEPFSLDVIVTSRVNIGSSEDPYRFRFYMPECVFNSANPGVPGPQILEEPFGFDCYPKPTDGTHPDELTVYLDNGVADMTV